MKLDPSVYQGKVVFVGIDVHRRSFAVVAQVEGQKPVKFSNLEADPKVLVDFLLRKFPDSRLRTVYEAGFSGFTLHRALTAAGVENLVVNPSSIEVAANDKVKTDRRDAAKMADELMRGKLRGIRIPSPEEEYARQITRTRMQLVHKRVAIGNQIKAKLMQFGFWKHDDERVMCLKRLKEIEALELDFELRLAISCLATIYREIHRQIAALEAQLGEQSKRSAEREAIYRSLPGFGPLTARIVENELGDMSQFPNARSIGAFLGFTPREYSSGTNKWGEERKRRGHITKQGRAMLRCVLVEAAWRAIEKDNSLKEVYERLKLRTGGKRAIVAVARRLIVRARRCVINGVPYCQTA
jgi:transposase